MQYYSLNAAFLWAAIVISSLLGIGVYLLVVAVESWVLRHERRSNRWEPDRDPIAAPRRPAGRAPRRVVEITGVSKVFAPRGRGPVPSRR